MAAPIAGGLHLANRLKTGIDLAHVIALAGIARLHGARTKGDAIEIGSMMTLAEIEADPLVRAHLPAVSTYISGLGNVRIRAQGTIGGNLMAGEPGYEVLPLLMAADATLHFVSGAQSARLTLAARTFGGSPAVPALLCQIEIPLRPVTILWDRSLRPNLTVVAAFARDRGRLSALGAALGTANRYPVWLAPVDPVPLDGADASTAARLAAEWTEPWLAAAWPKRAAAALLSRAIRREAVAP
jgi:CO/xanthine dehydrogenase FAD-binding subunit